MMSFLSNLFTSSPTHILLDDGNLVPVQESRLYTGFVHVHEESSTPNFFILKADLKIEKADTGTHYKFLDGGQPFRQAYQAWRMNNLMWYRGLQCTHFSYPDVRNTSILRSEGDADMPTFTMGNAPGAGTCWLPGVFDESLAQGVCFSDKARSIMVLAHDRHSCVPFGITVKAKLGKDINIRCAWLNSGEQVIKGPLDFSTHFLIHSIACFNVDLPVHLSWPEPTPPTSLPPEQGYHWIQLDYTNWYDTIFIPWKQANAALFVNDLAAFLPVGT